MCNAANCTHTAFDALDDDLSDVFGAPVAAARPVAIDTTLADAQISNTRRFEEKCRKCNGTGRFIGYTGRVLGNCFACKGEGKAYYKTSSEDRAKAKAQRDAAAARKANEAAEQAAAWLQANPVEAQWLGEAGKTLEFAADMVQALFKYGSFTEKQEAAVRNAAAKSAAKKAQWAAEQAAREADAATLSLAKIRAGFDAASQHLKRPKLRIADIQFSLAPATGRNAGCIYVVRASDDTYLGKITLDDKFITSRDCTAADSELVARVAADPLAAATAHGHEYGYCSCCGRELTNPESVARGIGPICAERWGW